MAEENQIQLDQLMSTFCEVKTLSNYLIVTGYVRDVGKDYIEITSKNDKMLLEKANSKVKIIINSKETGWRTFMGTVYLSTEQFMRIVDLQTLASFEQRSYFRVPIQLSADAKKKTEDEDLQSIENNADCIPVNIKDASLGGLLFQSDEHFSPGEELTICIPIGEKNLFLSAVIRRVICQEESSCYGCEFVNPSQAEMDSLHKFLLQEQISQIRIRNSK